MKTAVKVCGLTQVENAMKIAASGVSYIGCIVDYPKSNRSVDVEVAQHIMSAVKRVHPKVKCVAVMVDPDLKDVERVSLFADIMQLHGSETVGFCASARNILPVWKALIVKEKADLQRVEDYRVVCDGILFDAGRGSGVTINKDLLEGQTIDILAGGISIENIERSVRAFTPKIIDLNSKFESSIGVKDDALVKKAIEIVSHI